MSERNQGKVVPFALSAYRMRRGADAYRKRGQMVEALELLRRAAVQEDSSLGWLRLARELRQCACYEQAAPILYRLCGREDMPPEAWLELGKCLRALERRDAACDCLYHYLQVDPYSDVADQVRDMLSDLEEVQDAREPFRLNLLVRRGLLAYRRGEQVLGERRLRRALRMGEDNIRLYTTLAMIYLAEGRCSEALRELRRAMKKEPESLRAMCMTAVTLSAMGKRRMALGMLERCAHLARTPSTEEQFLTAAWTIGAQRTARRYLESRLKLQPCRIALMHPLADLLWQAGEQDMALRWWKRILAIEPEDLRARAMVNWAPEHPEDNLPPMGALPGEFVRAQLSHLSALTVVDTPAEALLRCGSRSRGVLDWCFTMIDENLQQAALHIAARQDAPCVRSYLHQLLTMPGVVQSVRQRAMMTLAEWGDPGPMNILIGSRITTAQLSPVKDTRQNLWKMFLPQLLRETRHTCNATEIAFFAADLWDVMRRNQRHRAAGPDCYLWVKAMEILYLRLTGQEDEAARVVRALPVSPRKISRIMRDLKRQTDISMEGETNP